MDLPLALERLIFCISLKAVHRIAQTSYSTRLALALEGLIFWISLKTVYPKAPSKLSSAATRRTRADTVLKSDGVEDSINVSSKIHMPLPASGEAWRLV